MPGANAETPHRRRGDRNVAIAPATGRTTRRRWRCRAGAAS